jgi:hypothetical protein
VRAEELTRLLQASPGDDAVGDELASLLEALDRGHELVALLGGRIEDAAGPRRDRLVAFAREILQRMAVRAAAAGRDSDASLFRDATDAFT